MSRFPRIFVNISQQSHEEPRETRELLEISVILRVILRLKPAKS